MTNIAGNRNLPEMICENEKTNEIINVFLTVILCKIIFVSLRLSISLILCVLPKMSGNAPVCSLGTLGQHFQAVVVNVITSLYIMTNEKNNKHNYILYETSLRIKRKKNHSKLAYKSWPIGVIAIAVLRGRLIFFYSFILMKRSCSRLREAMLPFNMFWIILN